MSEQNKSIEQAERRAAEMLWEDRLRQRMQQQGTFVAEPVVRRMPDWRILAAAASVALVVGFFFLLPPSDERGGVRGSTDAPSALQVAAEAMEQKDYARALTALEQADLPDYAERIALMKGECQYRLERTTEAIQTYRQLLQKPDLTAISRSEANIKLAALLFLTDKNNPELRPLLQEIIENDPGNAEDAQKMLKEIGG